MNECQRLDSASQFRFIEFLPRDPAASDAVIIYLHGSGERGGDLSLVKHYGLPALLATSEVSVNCSVLCPQLEAGANWDADRIAVFVEAMTTQVQKIALIGYSLGASGVCQVVSRYGPLVDVAVAIAGQAPKSAETKQSGTRLLSIQGELDPWPDTSSFVESVNASGGWAQSITLDGKAHFISEDALFNPILIALLRNVSIELVSLTSRSPMCIPISTPMTP